VLGSNQRISGFVRYQKIPFDLLLTCNNKSNCEPTTPSVLSLNKYNHEKPEKSDQIMVDNIGNLLSNDAKYSLARR